MPTPVSIVSSPAAQSSTTSGSAVRSSSSVDDGKVHSMAPSPERSPSAGKGCRRGVGVDLTDCCLLHPVLDLDQGAGLRSLSIYAFPVGDVPSGGQRIELTERCYRLTENESMGQFFERSTLAKAQTTWGSAFRSVVSNLGYGSGSSIGAAVGQEQKALLLMSTIGEFDPTQDATMAGHLLGYASWSRECLRQLDLRQRLTRNSVILLGFTADPGPMRLFRRTCDSSYRPLNPDTDASWTMYRIRIPVTLVSGPGDGGQEEDELEDLIEARSRRVE